MKNLQATHEKKLRDSARNLIIAPIVVLVVILLLSFISGTFNTPSNILLLASVSFGTLIGALRIILLYLADQSAVIDRQTQQLASIEKRLEDTRQTAKQALAAVNSQKEKV